MGLDDDDMAAFAALGVTVVAAEGDEAEVVEIDPTEVWSTNWEAFLVFVALATQWRVVGVGTAIVRLGLDYAEADRMIARAGADPDVFWDLQVMEGTALPILNEVVDE